MIVMSIRWFPVYVKQSVYYNKNTLTVPAGTVGGLSRLENNLGYRERYTIRIGSDPIKLVGIFILSPRH